MDPDRSVRLREDLPFRRVALVLAGGGALGAYEAGVLRVLSEVGLRPAIIAGTSAGAINAVVWLAHDCRSEILERTWSEIRAATIGMRWTTLSLRAGGMLLAGFGAVQALLTILGSPELGVAGRAWVDWALEGLVASAVLDVLAWLFVFALGVAMVKLSRPAEEWLAVLQRPGQRVLEQRWLGWLLLLGAVVHVAVWVMGVPWPHRFGATLLALGSLLWLVNRPGRTGSLLRGLLGRLLPETHGRGLWGGAARRRLLQRLVRAGDPGRLTRPGSLLVLSALALDTGRIAYFVAGDEPEPSFAAQIRGVLGEVIRVATVRDIVDAAVASSAIPLAFEPVSVVGREFVDAGQFSNQPLEAAMAAGADALLVVLVAPRSGPSPAGRDATLVALGARLFEIASWRELQLSLHTLPDEWTRARRDGAAPLCVVEPRAPLGAGLVTFEPAVSIEMMNQGELDARSALLRAGWVVESDPAL